MGAFVQPPNMPEQPLTVPRRSMDIEDYIDVLRRHRSWILGPVFVGLVVGVVTAFLWPDSYLSSGLIRVVPPQVPTRLIQSNVSEELTQRINSTYQDIEKRENLLNLIQTYNLYPEDRKRLPNEDLVEQMRRDISVGQMQYMSRGAGAMRQNVNAFAVSFSYSDRKLAQKVCTDLISKFIESSIKSRSTQSVMTTEFFKDQYDVAKRELEEIDKKITAYRVSNAGELPEQEQLLLTRVTAMEASIQATNAQISRANQDKLQLETQLRVLREQATQTMAQAAQQQPPAVVVGQNERLAEADREIDRVQAQLAGLKESYKENHPDVVRMNAYLQTKLKQREQIAKEVESAKAEAAANPKPVPVVTDAANKELNETKAAIARLQSALQAKDMELEDLAKQQAETREKLKIAQARMEASPASSEGYLKLIRERGMASKRYEELTLKMQDSSMATDLENRKQGEMLEVLETPSIPEAPYAPKRPYIIMLGLLAGASIGIAAAGAREIKDTSLKNLKDVRAYTKLTVLGSIPLLENDFIVRRRRRMGWLAWTATFLLGVLLMAGSVVYYYTAKA
jgi:polysaccharide chain length determinant protein (PEP-CTERM system associated)